MPIDWDKIDIEGAVDRADRRTRARLAGKISSLTRFTDEEIEKWFPEEVDKKNLAKMMQSVKTATTENEKQQRIIDGIETFAKSIVTIIDKFI